MEDFIRFSYVYSPDGLNNTLLSQGCILKAPPSVVTMDGMPIPRIGEGVRIF